MRQNKILPAIPSNFVLSDRSFVNVPPTSINYTELASTYHFLHNSEWERGTGFSKETDIVHLLLFVDRMGSMTPFHRRCDEFCKAIQQFKKQSDVAIYYYHNMPTEDNVEIEITLASTTNQLLPSSETLFTDIKPLSEGYLYSDSDLLLPHPFQEILQKYTDETAVLFIGDAGISSLRYNLLRLFITLAFLKAISSCGLNYAWLNPLPKNYWYNRNNVASCIARYIPMFPLNNEGFYYAFNALLHPPEMEEEELL